MARRKKATPRRKKATPGRKKATPGRKKASRKRPAPARRKAAKSVYFFGGGRADGRASQRDLLGGKGANLAEMTRLGVPVPAGFTIATSVSLDSFRSGSELSASLKKEILYGL